MQKTLSNRQKGVQLVQLSQKTLRRKRTKQNKTKQKNRRAEMLNSVQNASKKLAFKVQRYNQKISQNLAFPIVKIN